MHSESRRKPALECCGLLAGGDGVITTVFPARNAHPSPATCYEIAPKELFQIFQEIRAQDLDHLGIYHSHPIGENSPSPTDIELAYYPDAAYFIVSPYPETKNSVRAFYIRDGHAEESKVKIVD